MSLHKGRQEPFSGINHGFDRKPVRRDAYSVDRPSGLRRVVSTRTLSPHLDSSESLPSEHSSLYDAFLSSYESEHNNAQPSRKKDDEESSEPTGVSHIQELRSWDGERARRRERLAVPSLETILENQSASTHRATSSRSRLRPCASVGVSLNSKYTCSGASSRAPSIRWNQYGSKIYSFDDHDIPSFRPKFSFSSFPRERRHSCSTLSSDGSFDTSCWLNNAISPAEPTQPIHPPPHRPSTPPGVPSFGSPEALNYDISSLPRGTPRAGRNSSRSSPQANRDLGEIDDDSSDEGYGCCGLGLRQAFRETTSYITYQPPERLPPGVLARAHDGTLIRGRFGARSSGHGIGATASLENHPFHQNYLPIARTVKDSDIRAPQPAYLRPRRHNTVDEFGLQRQFPRGSSVGSPNPPPRYRSLFDDHRDLPAPSTPVRVSSLTRNNNHAIPSRPREQMSYPRPASTTVIDRNTSARDQSEPNSSQTGLLRLLHLVSSNVTKCCCGLGADDEHEGRRGTEMQQISSNARPLG